MKNIKTVLRQTSKVLAAFVAAMALPVMATTLGGNSARAEGHEVDFSVTLAPSLQVVIPASTVSLDIVPKVGESVFASEDLTVSIATNNPTGYKLTLEAEATDLTRTEADNYGNFPTIATLDKLEGGYTQDTFTVNRWGYKQDTNNYNAFESGVELSATTGPTNIEETTLTFGAKVDMQQQAGTYALALNFVAVTNVVPGVYTINFNGNGADGGSTASQQIEAGQSANLNKNGFTRTDYNFVGWNTQANGSGTSYSDGALYAAELTADNTTVTLYAQWEIATIYMQNVTAAQCTESPLTAVDNRDNTEYLIAKLADGNCWMLQNLKLGSKADTYTLTTANSDGNFTLNGKSSNGVFTNAQSNGVNGTNDSSQFYCTDAYGCYYNWYTATAGSGTSLISTQGQSVATSICPKGWTLPTGGAGGQFEALAAAYNNSATTMLVNPTTLTENASGQKPGLLLGGYYYTSGAYYVGTYGSYWSRTAYSGQNGYNLYLNTSTVYPSGNGSKYVGWSVRCVLK